MLTNVIKPDCKVLPTMLNIWQWIWMYSIKWHEHKCIHPNIYGEYWRSTL